MADKLPGKMDLIVRDASPPKDGVGLCLSGGGYRAMLFHVGSVWRLVEAEKLKSLTHISSVSGGSIFAGVLALAWDKLADGDVAAYQQHIVAPVRKLAEATLDVSSGLKGLFMLGSISSKVAHAYDEFLFDGKTLQDLPDAPFFLFNSTNVETGTRFEFSKKRNHDWRVGNMPNPKTPLSHAVAASSSFPPVLSPFILETKPDEFTHGTYSEAEKLDDSFRQEISLTDGGVYDNIGLEPIWKVCKTIYVSDGGSKIADDSEPASDWARHAMRIMLLLDHQVRNLRKRQIMGLYEGKARKGTYWGMGANITDYDVADPLGCPPEKTSRLAQEPTRLAAIPAWRQKQIINWGYAVTDAALRKWDDVKTLPTQFPYPDEGVG